jgi:hypothetical protein
LNRGELESLLKETDLDDQMQFLDLWEEWEKGTRGRPATR